MRALASFQDLYVGLEPYRNNGEVAGGVIKKTAPAVFGLLAALELHPSNKLAGVHAPIGGFQAVSSAFERLAVDCGVKILYEKTVTAIEKDCIWYLDGTSGKKEKMSTQITVVNADLPFATKTLLSKSSNGVPSDVAPCYDWDDKFDFSSGVIAFHWSVKKECKALNTHNVFLSGRTRADVTSSWSSVRENDPSILPSFGKDPPFNFYVHRASASDVTAAPQGCDSIMVLVPCCTLQHDSSFGSLSRSECINKYKAQFSDSIVAEVKGAVLKRLSVLDELTDLDSVIVGEVIDTPGTYADLYNLAAGTPFALSHGFGQLSLTRPSHQSKQFDNVLFVGASTRPGNGVPLVLLGAKQVAQKAVTKILTHQQAAKQRYLY